VELYRSVLKKYSLKGAREYLKLARRLEKELRNEEFLVQKMIETDSDLVQVRLCEIYMEIFICGLRICCLAEWFPSFQYIFLLFHS
jgi:hypothetical protein